MQKKPTILIVEDSEPTRLYLEDAIVRADQFKVVAAVSSYTAAADILRNSTPDILMTDLDLPDGNGINLIKMLHLPEVPSFLAIVISIFEDAPHVLDALKAGASGYLLKDDNYISINNAISQMLKGGAPISPSIACHLLLSEISSSWASLGSIGEVYGFFMFLALNLYVVIKGADSIKQLENWSAPILLTVGIGLMLWAFPQINLTEIISTKANRPESDSAAPYLMAGITAMVGFWATLSLNIPDFSRFVKSQKDQITGQILGLPLTMFFFAALGVVLTAASSTLVGETISDPINLIGKIDNPLMVVIAMVLIIIATLSTNSAANIVSPTNDFQNVAPKFINEKRGVLLTGLIGVLMMSWELLKKMHWIESDVSVEALYSNWLLGYSSLLGPIAGIMIVDYFVINKQQLDLVSLYKQGGVYPNVNVQGLIAFLIPVALTIFSLSTGKLHWFYNYGWFTGSLFGAFIYYILKFKKVNS